MFPFSPLAIQLTQLRFVHWWSKLITTKPWNLDESTNKVALFRRSNFQALFQIINYRFRHCDYLVNRRKFYTLTFSRQAEVNHCTRNNMYSKASTIQKNLTVRLTNIPIKVSIFFIVIFLLQWHFLTSTSTAKQMYWPAKSPRILWALPPTLYSTLWSLRSHT